MDSFEVFLVGRYPVLLLAMSNTTPVWLLADHPLTQWRNPAGSGQPTLKSGFD
jgi:hypothetical protein